MSGTDPPTVFGRGESRPAPEANLETARLQRANLRGANLQGAWIEGVSPMSLLGANVQGADFRSFLPGLPKLHVSGAGPKLEQMQFATNRDLAFYDEDLLPLLGLPPDHYETLPAKLEELRKQAEQATCALTELGFIATQDAFGRSGKTGDLAKLAPAGR